MGEQTTQGSIGGADYTGQYKESRLHKTVHREQTAQDNTGRGDYTRQYRENRLYNTTGS